MPADPVVALLPVTQADREAAASVLPPHVRAEVIAGDHDTTGVCSAVVQAFARHRTPAPAGDVRVVPVDDDARPLSDSLLPQAMIDAGIAVLDQVQVDSLDYTSGVTTDWDDGMVAVAVYRAMIAASPTPDSSAVSGSAEVLREAPDLRARLGRAIDGFPSMLHSEKIDAVLAALTEGQQS